MSLPINPLTKYQSYSYQQILIACDTTETAEKLSESNQFLDFVRSSDANRVNSTEKPYAKYEPYDVNLDKGRKGHYVIIINGMQDAEFVINKSHWYNVVAASAGTEGTKFSTYNIEGELEISEPQGIRFMNVMAKVADNLESDPSGLIFMLKTIFTGHRTPTFEDDGFQEPITNIKPLLFWIAGITGGFDVSGGNYKVELAGINHGLTKKKHILHGADRIKINISKKEEGCEANTLSGALCKLQKQVREIYTKYFNTIKDEVENTVDEKGNKVKFKGRKVEYVIEAESPLDGGDYLVTDFKDSATDTAETGKAGTIELSKEPSVEAAILAIANRCPKIQEDLNTGDGTNVKQVRYITKVATTIVSTDTEYKIIYKLRRVVESRSDLLSILAKRVDDEVDDLNDEILDNLLELDYMYTGKNTDIIDFDIKMAMGLVLFQNLTTIDNIPTNQQQTDGGSIDSSIVLKNPVDVQYTFNDTIRENTPIFLSTRTDYEAIKHAINPKRSGTYQEQLARHAALENMEAVVKIHGNPGLLDDVNIPPSQIASGDIVKPGKTVFAHWETLPAIVKIRIKMPSVYYGGSQNQNDFGENFWYNGFYYCYAIEQTFDSGEFTQQLHMVSIPKSTPAANQQTSKSQTDQEAQTAAANQASNTAGSGTSTGEIPVAGNTDIITLIINTTAGESLDKHSGN